MNDIDETANRLLEGCKVCGNEPKIDAAEIAHGKGCYTQSPFGGGTSFIEVESGHIKAMARLWLMKDTLLTKAEIEQVLREID